ALSLATALECRVEELFGASSVHESTLNWAWPVDRTPCRFWRAEIGGKRLLYPAEATTFVALPHDGVAGAGFVQSERHDRATETLVLASCDPAAALLASEYSHRTGLRLLVLGRASRESLRLLGDGIVHAAGVHLSKSRRRTGNARKVREQLGAGYSLLHVARWDEGLALGHGQTAKSVNDAVASRMRWIGREPGSGARQCLDEVLQDRPSPKHIARDHRGVADAIRNGWADAGICLRLVAEEAGLRFLSVRQESYDIVYRTAVADEPRLRALVTVIRSPQFRKLLSELPGYDTASTGELVES
ncbi:MAG TPA: substrate-binding domain-containing protein, partial [Planctomycetaceae bacterium]|nr:substrate-binding domain-containing protein [Planctomycetaceae bacterium]